MAKLLFFILLFCAGAMVRAAPFKEFQTKKDGFSFRNYGNQKGTQNLTNQTFERLCGPDACARGRGETCVPAGGLRPFLDHANRSMAGGHCEGMSVLAQAIYYKRVPLQTFDRKAASTFDLSFDNKVVQSEIAYWFATQLTYPAGYSELKLSPAQVVQELSNQRERYSIGVFQPDKSDGHAVTPIKLIRDTPVQWRIQIYDSNFPGDENRFIKIDTARNTWSYAQYVGNAKTLTLTLRPFSKRLSQQQCPTLQKDNTWMIWLDGAGKLRAPKDAKTLWRTASASRFRQAGLEPIYLIKPGEGISLGVVGEGHMSNETTNLVIFKEGQSFALEGIKLSRKEVDSVYLAKDQNTISYSTADREKVTVRIALTYEGADYELKIYPWSLMRGFDIEAHNKTDNVRGDHELLLTLKPRHQRTGRFSVELTRIGDKKDDNFTHVLRDIIIHPDERVTLEYGKWLKDGQSLSILRDRDSDGKIDAKQDLADEK